VVLTGFITGKHDRILPPAHGTNDGIVFRPETDNGCTIYSMTVVYIDWLLGFVSGFLGTTKTYLFIHIMTKILTVSDATVLVLPFPTVKKLTSLKPAEKIGLRIVFMSGLASLSISTARIIVFSLLTWSESNSKQLKVLK
jgi:hypothetical protein